ncbi:28S ribosomal protein S10, mitochondrial [Copidosoma floridanum]|uniref:28S ribosomal protein S10, mitochondrial n=1 Tax=Copidosoma floridanum TaxID=29053 RepID=UPI0006C9C574|nr:28S ribosomal protein S10, mitochondrial [Copidosoma floridanum]
MLLSRIVNEFTSVVVRQLPQNRILASMLCKQFSSDLPSTEIAKPDKLFKKIEVEVRGNDTAVLQSYGTFVTTAANHLGINVGHNFAPKKGVHERLTLLKSKHVHKKHRVQYETRTYYRFMHFLKLTGSTADTFLEYIQRNLPEGVAMKVTKIEIQRLPEAISSPPS